MAYFTIQDGLLTERVDVVSEPGLGISLSVTLDPEDAGVVSNVLIPIGALPWLVAQLRGDSGRIGEGNHLMLYPTARAAAEAAMRDFKATLENLDRKLDEAIRVCTEEAARLKALAAEREAKSKETAP